MISYTKDQTPHLNYGLVYTSKPIDTDLQGWANRMRQYAEDLKQLTKHDPALAADLMYLDNLANDSQEIVYLFQYAKNAPAPFTGKGPPPLWMTRYNEVAYEMEMSIQVLESDAPGCAARPQPPEPPATTPTTTPKPLPAADITDKLLKPSELASIVGDPDMTEVDPFTQIGIQTQGVDPPDCAARTRVGNTFPYYGSGRGPAAGSLNLNPNLVAQGPRVLQLITVWQDSEQPTKVVSQSAHEWEHYCQQPFTTTADNSDATIRWLPQPVERDPPTRIITWDQRDDGRRICYHVMASRAKLLVEDIACGDTNTDDQVKGIANEVADGILNNFPQ